VAGLLTAEQAEALLQALKQTKEAEVSNRLQASLVEGDKATFGWMTTDGHSGGGSTLLLEQTSWRVRLRIDNLLIWNSDLRRNALRRPRFPELIWL